MSAIVQHAKYDPNVNGTAVALTLSGSPVAGNILVAFTAYSQFGGTRTVGSASGTWTKVDDASQTNDSLAVWWHLVVGGDGTSWSFPITGGSEGVGGVIYELSGTDTTAPINQHSILGYTGTGSPATTGITPSVLNCLALAGITGDGSNATAVSAGWTLDQAGSQGHHAACAASRNTLTADTTTAIAVTFTLTTSDTGVIAAVLIAPPAAAAANPPYQPLYLTAPVLAQ